MAWRDWGGGRVGNQGTKRGTTDLPARGSVAMSMWAAQDAQLAAEFQAAQAEGDPQQLAPGCGRCPHRTEKSENTYNLPKLPTYYLQLTETQCPPTSTHCPFQQLLRFFLEYAICQATCMPPGIWKVGVLRTSSINS